MKRASTDAPGPRLTSVAELPTRARAKLRTRVVWALMRMVSPATLRRWHDAAWFAPVDRFLRAGSLQVLGGLAVNARLAAGLFPYWGVQSYGMLAGVHEPMVQEALRRSLPAGGVFLDVGSHVGLTALLACRLVGPSGTVIALDAQSESVAAVAANAVLNGHRNLEALHLAAADRSGSAEVIITADELWSRLASVGEHENEVRRDVVATTTVDDLVAARGLRRVDAVKIDVEGAEIAVLDGMRETLRRDSPILICEMHGKNAQYVATLDALGYETICLDGPEPVVDADSNAHTYARKVPAGAGLGEG